MPGDISERIRSRVTFDEINGFQVTIPSSTEPPPALLLQLPLGTVILLGSLWFALAILELWWNRNVAALKPPPWLFVVTGIAAYCVIPWVIRWKKSCCYEVIRFDGDILTLSGQGFSFQDWSDCPYRLSKIRNLRYAPSQDLGGSGDPSNRASLAFDYGGQTILFGMDLSEEESRRLIRTIKDRYKIPDDKDEPLPVERL